MAQEYDSPWKEALHVYFPQFLALLFPEVHQAIDWSLGWQVMETELLSPAAGPRRVDVLMQVTMVDGKATVILIHVEVQNQKKQNFPERLFDYHYRLRLGFGLPVCTLVVRELSASSLGNGRGPMVASVYDQASDDGTSPIEQRAQSVARAAQRPDADPRSNLGESGSTRP